MAPQIVAWETAKALSVPPPKGAPHGVALPGSEQHGRSAIYRAWNAVDGLVGLFDPSINTGHELFEFASKAFADKKCLGKRNRDMATGKWGPYEWQDYNTIGARRLNIGAGIVELHEKIGIFGEQYGVGLWCQNRPEWQLVDLGCMSQNLFSVSIYETLGPEATEFIVNHADLACAAVNLNHIPTLLQRKDAMPKLKILISMDPLDDNDLPGYNKREILGAWAATKGVQLHYIGDVEKLGAESGRSIRPPKPTDLITINYTSGTTGDPKGVLLTHANCVSAVVQSLLTTYPCSEEEVGVSYMPLAHIYERLTEAGAFMIGAAIGYFHGDILELGDDIKLLRPTSFPSVPRLFNRFAGGIKAATIEAPGFKGALSRHVVETKLANLNAGQGNSHALYDRIWAKKVAAQLGMERTSKLVSGSAPIAPEVLQFLRIVFGGNFVQGYGLTETYAEAMCQLPSDHTAGSCGPPTVTNELQLRDVPSMDYFATDKPNPRGELYVRGYNVFKGYHKNPEKTAEALDPDGWFATGDICSVDSLGRFTVIDRVKNILKLAQGEYVSPERIENIYLANLNIVATAYVHGDSVQNFLIAIFGVNPEVFASFASRVLKTQIAPTDILGIKNACANSKVREAVQKEMDKVAKRAKMARYEAVKNISLMVDPFTVDNELLTPTLKLKRPQTAKMYRKEIDSLYAEALERDPPKKARL